VLIVDDREGLRARLVFVLRARGFWTSDADDLRAGLGALGGDAPDAVVVSDLHRQHRNGLEMLERIGSRCKLPVFCVSLSPDWHGGYWAACTGETYFYRWPLDLRRLADDVAVRLGVGSRTAASVCSPTATHREHRETIECALLVARGNMLQAAKLLGVSRLTLYRWIARYEIGRENPTRNPSELGPWGSGR
jgi:DNA-binding NtrC family response regulator